MLSDPKSGYFSKINFDYFALFPQSSVPVSRLFLISSNGILLIDKIKIAIIYKTFP